MKKSIVVSLASIIALNTICLSSVTIAWFTAKNNVNNNANSIVAVDSNLIESIEVFNIYDGDDIEEEDGYRYLSLTASDHLELPEYTLIDNEFQSLIKVTLTKKFSSIAISAETFEKNPIYLGDLSDSDMTELKSDDNPLSNITNFYVLPGNTTALTKLTNCYQLSYTGEETRYTLVDREGSRFTKMKMNSDEYGYVSLGSLSNVEVFYIVMEYNIESIDQIYTKYLGESITSSGDGIGFVMDYYFHLDDSSGGEA